MEDINVVLLNMLENIENCCAIETKYLTNVNNDF